MLFRSLLSRNAKKACTGVGYGGVCYAIGDVYYKNGKPAYIY